MSWIPFLLSIVITVVGIGLIAIFNDFSTYRDLQRRLREEKERRDYR